MKVLFTIVALVLFSYSSHSQLTSNNWLVGGTGSYFSTKNTYSSLNYYQTSDEINIKVSPNIGYFLIDKLALGLRPSFTKYKAQVTNGGYSNENRLEIGPFARYYLLNAENQYNILTDISYQYGIYRFKPSKGNINTFSASAGPVIYFNSSVGLEFLVGYYRRKEEIDDLHNTEQKGLQVSIGFQIHLEKETF